MKKFKDVNEEYKKNIMAYMEETNDPLWRERQCYQDDILRVCVDPKLSDEYRVHIMRRAYFTIQRKMFESGLITVPVFEASIRDNKEDGYTWLADLLPFWVCLRDKFDGNLQAIYDHIKSFDAPLTLRWFEELAIKSQDCPIEILKKKYTAIKETA